MREADLSGAILIRATWLEGGPNGGGADLTEAKLIGANLSQMILETSEARRADLAGADLSGIRIKDVNFSRANLAKTDFSGADVRADLSEVNLFRANLDGADFFETILNRADLSEAYLNGTTLPPEEPGRMDGIVMPDREQRP